MKREKLSNLEIRKTLEIHASPATVFKALIDPAELTQWFPDKAVLEPKVGGTVIFSFYKDSDKREMKNPMDFFPEGKIVEIVPNQKISYTWKPRGLQNFPDTLVTWTLEEIGKNKTRVTLLHSGFVDRERDMFEGHDEGWSYFVDRLAKYTTKKDFKIS